MMPDDFSRLLSRQAQYRLRNYDQALNLAIELVKIATESDNEIYLVQALFLQGEALEKVGEFSKSKTVLLELENMLLLKDKQDPLLLDVYECLGKACYAIGELNLALDYWSRCLELALECQSIVHYIKAYTGIGGVYLYFGLYQESLRHHLLALEYAQELDDAVLLMMLNLWLGSDYNQLGQYELALSHLNQARGFYRRQADAGQVCEVIMHMGFSYLGMNELALAAKQFNESIEIAERNHHAWPLAMATMGLAEVKLAQGLPNDSLMLAKIAHEYAIKNNSIHHELRACKIKSAALEAVGQYESALSAYERHCELSVQLATERNNTQLQSATLRKINRSEIRLKLLKTEQQRKNLEEENIRRQAEYLAEKNALLAVNQAKSDFLALISHEIRTPLSGVIGMLRLAKSQKELRPATREQISTGLENAELLLGIINDILDASKIEAGKISIEVIPFDLHKVIAQVSALFATRAEEKGLSFIVDVAHLPHGGSLGDPTRIRQVLFNLISNAIKFTEKGSIRLSAYRDGEQVKFSIVDTGIGMDEQSLGRLFRKFEQADSSTTRKYGGTGLGLSICHSLVELMQGSIGVTSEIGVGTCFRVDLPLEPVQLVEDAPEGPIVIEPLRYHLNVLYAEDIVTNQLIVGALLEEMGLPIKVVSTGLAALEILSKEHFDLVLMDGRMPVMDGLMATRLIREGGNRSLKVLDPQIYIVALTANATEEERRAGFAVGMNDYLVKPIDPQQLRQVIENATLYQLERGHTLKSMRSAAPLEHEQLNEADDHFLRQLSQAGVDVKDALGRLNGNVTRLKRWLLQFFSEQKTLFDEIEQLCHEQQVLPLLNKVHALRGVAGTLGLSALYEAASVFEQNLNYFQKHGAGFPDSLRLRYAWGQAIKHIAPLVQSTGTPVSAQLPVHCLPLEVQADAQALLQALQENSLRARQKLQQLLSKLNDDATAQSLQAVVNALDGLDYPAALAALTPLLNEQQHEE